MKLLALPALLASFAASADHDVVRVAPPAQPAPVEQAQPADPAVQRWLALGSRSFASRDAAYAFQWKLEQAGVRAMVQHDPMLRCWVCRFA
ncbi:MAG: hypothetical protein JNL12_21290 [Planctomycetes bacterium]|nr:hypothetical protein [Planctomycetota bacterium]